MNNQLIKRQCVAFYVLLLLMIAALPLHAQKSTYSKEVETNIKKVEQNLGEAIKTSNEPIYLFDRMKEYNVHAVSIAVIKDYKLEWARAYGFADKE